MTTLHPHWQPTDSAPAAPLAATHTPGKRISRQPAALTGIAVVVLGLAAAAGALPQLQATAVPLATVTVSASGFSPPTVELTDGGMLVVQNTTDNLQQLVSPTLCNGGICFQSDVIAPGATVQVPLPLMGAEGTHQYFLLDNPAVSGTIVIGNPNQPAALAAEPTGLIMPPIPEQNSANGALDAVPPPANAQTDFPMAPSDIPGNSAPMLPAAPAAALPVQEPAALGGQLAVNPYTVDSEPQFANDALVPMHAGAPLKPHQQPKTGPEEAVVIFATLCVFLLAVRKSRTGRFLA